MSAAALKCLASAAATSIYDAIGVAQTPADLDHLFRLASRGFGDGTISPNDAQHLFEYIYLRRRPVRRAVHQPTLPGLPLPKPNLRRVGSFPERRAQRSPDKQASRERLHRQAYSGVMPRELGARLTPGDMAVMSVVADEY